ncbi:radical SAM protein [Geotalea toluenoxydans]|uniref:radical SAM protein n=1 Tax=Geotalea toluenoxydans TaxID=421624 RepID=UPI000A829EF5|nr:radical SAM protein [Geotalea toluenoxydans]
MKCNLSCYGCYAGDYQKSLELSLEEIDSVLTQMKEMGVYFAVISGGEPFFKDDIFEIFRKHSDMAFLVFTHGVDRRGYGGATHRGRQCHARLFP